MELTVRVTALDKLADYVASGVGSIAGSMLAPWGARRRAEAGRIAAQGEADSQAILASGQARSLSAITTAQADARRQLGTTGVAAESHLTTDSRIEQRLSFQETKRQENIESIVHKAAASLPEGEIANHEPDHDWTARFFNEAQDVSSDDMQTLWAKVLAGQVERPGGTSIRTLGVLRDLDRPAAVIFRKLCSASVSLKPDGNIILDARVASLGGSPGANALKDYGLGFDSLNILNEHGLIIADYNSYYDYRLSLGVPLPGRTEFLRIPFCFQDRFWVLEQSTERSKSEEFRVSGVALTRAGRELSRVADLEPVPKYAQALMKFFEKQKLRMVEVDSMQPRTVVR